MTIQSRLGVRLRIPIQLNIAQPVYYVAGLEMYVGPFQSQIDASVWERQFLQAATIGWHGTQLRQRREIREIRSASGRWVKELFDRERILVGVRSDQDRPPQSTHLNIDEGIEEHVTKPATRSSMDDLFDINPVAYSPLEVGHDLLRFFTQINEARNEAIKR